MKSFFENIVSCIKGKSKENENKSENLIRIRMQHIMNNLSLPNVLIEMIISYDYYYFEGKLVKKFGDIINGPFYSSTNINCIQTIAVHPNGNIITGSTTGLIKVWNMATGNCEIMFFGHTNGISCINFLQNGYVVSGSYDRTLKLWNITKKYDILIIFCGWELELSEHSNKIKCITVLKNDFIVSGSSDKTLRIWNPHTKICKNILCGHTKSIDSVSTLPNCPIEMIVSGSKDGTIKIWNSVTGSCNVTFNTYWITHTPLTVLPNGLIAYGSHRYLLSANSKNKKQILYDNISNGGCDLVITRNVANEIISKWSDGIMVSTNVISSTNNNESKHVRTNCNTFAAHSNGYIVCGSINGKIEVWA
jgi:WD40 repeat protein